MKLQQNLVLIFENFYLDVCSPYRAWLGFYTLTSNAIWLWTDKTPFHYAHWSVSQPDNPGVENCGHLEIAVCPGSIVQVDYWNNLGCDNVVDYFVCKKGRS